MPKTAILSDIHSNLPALRAVLRDLADADVDRIVFGGDIVGYGAHPMECLDIVRRLGGEGVIGNHDHYTVALSRQPRHLRDLAIDDDPVMAGIGHAARQLDPENIEWLRGLPWMIRLDGPAVLAHASLHEPEEWHYLLDPESAAPTLALLQKHGVGVGFFGHTHAQEIFFDEEAGPAPERLDETRTLLPEGCCCAVVVGSVGQPRGGDDVRASWTLWDPEGRVAQFRRTAYPTMEAALDILEAGLPAHSALRLLEEGQRRKLLDEARVGIGEAAE